MFKHQIPDFVLHKVTNWPYQTHSGPLTSCISIAQRLLRSPDSQTISQDLLSQCGRVSGPEFLNSQASQGIFQVIKYYNMMFHLAKLQTPFGGTDLTDPLLAQGTLFPHCYMKITVTMPSVDGLYGFWND